jgi:thiol-disulfide isomerase/thioredoxin
MHRQNILAIGLLAVVSGTVLSAGYLTGRGPFGVLSHAIASVRRGDKSPAELTPESTSPAAPEFAPGDWINSEPLKLSSLRGRVVLVEFWTFGCYNCRNTLPSVKAWDARYREKGLTVVGVHSPEFDEEKILANVRSEVASLDIKFPVVTDNDYATWRAFDVEAWPTLFVLDKSGRIRWKHVGEGSYDQTEQVIWKLLAEADRQAGN